MNKRLWIALLAVAALGGAVFAGEGHKCTADTQTCLNMMARNLKGKGWVGIELDQDESTGRMTITAVVPDSPAAAAGLQEGDVLLAMNGIQLIEENKEQTYAAMKEMVPGKRIAYTVDRAGNNVEVPVTLGELPEKLMAEWLGRHMLDHAVLEVAQN